MNARSKPVLVTVSGTIPPDLIPSIAAQRRPRADYIEIAVSSDGELLDRPMVRAELGPIGSLLERLAGPDVAMAVACALRRSRHRVVFTDGEQVGIPYAIISRLLRQRPLHVMVGHRLSAPKKVWLHRWLRLEQCIDLLVVYASEQRRHAIEELRYPPDRVILHPFMVDTEFWQPDGLEVDGCTRPLIAAVGQELRDYRTLVEAVRGVDADLFIAAASPWSKRSDSSAGIDLPPNVHVGRLDQFALRQLYAEASLVVVPLQETDFQAGITTILEAMSMGRATICTRTDGQTDTIVDGETGRYVPPRDVPALRATIEELLGDPEECDRLGKAARRWAEGNADIKRYADDLAELTAGAMSTSVQLPTRVQRSR